MEGLMTETKPVSLKTQLEGMTKHELISFAGDKFGVNVAAHLSENVIVDTILKFDHDRRKQARTLNEESAAMVANEADPLVKVRFMRMDFPNANLEFSYDSGRGIRVLGKRKGNVSPEQRKVLANRLPRSPKYNLFSGEVYDLPLSVIRHLESRTMSDSRPVIDQVSGMISGNEPVIKPRFILNVIMTDEQIKQVASLGKDTL